MKLSQFLFIILLGIVTAILPIVLMKSVSFILGVIVGVILFVTWGLLYDKFESGVYYEDEEGFYEDIWFIILK